MSLEIELESKCELWLDDYLVGVTEFDVAPLLILLFRSADRRVLTGRVDQLPVKSRKWMQHVSPDEVVHYVYYSAPIDAIRNRLDLLGYTLDTARLACVRERQCSVAHEMRLTERFPEMRPLIEVERSVDADTWIAALREIKARHLIPAETYEQTCNQEDPTIAHLLQVESLGCSAPDLAVTLRLAIEAMPEDVECILDVTELVLYAPDNSDVDIDFVEYALTWDEDESFSRSIIVLTEGSTDSWILSESLELLYPHLSNYFAFLDFSDCNVSGGAGNLANIVKAFCGARVINRTIAVFGYDTGAAAALRGLEDITIPKNVVVQTLPDVNLLRRYPTLGPTGLTDMDVNGMAGGIELYLGDDVLRDSHGNYHPVQWTGYSAGVGKYQGEVLNKTGIQRSFRDKLTRCKADREQIAKTDWSGIRAILSLLFTAFHEYDQERILAWIDASWDF